jgi:prepilin-type N-terminal cleavage/methylation domain-containing protein
LKPAPPTLDVRASRATRLNGLTLIELLVVIIILTTLVSAAIPLLSPTNDDRRLREASRGVNAFISAAQMKAIQLQRPFGVALKRLAQDTNPNPANPSLPHADNAVSVELYYLEQPTPFIGFDDTSAVQMSLDTGTGIVVGQVRIRFVRRGNDEPRTTDDLPDGWDRDAIPPYTIRPGDVIEVGGSRFTISDGTLDVDASGYYTPTSGTPDGTLFALPLNEAGPQINVEFDDLGRRMRDLPPGTSPPPESPFWTYPAPYKILRQPMPASAEPFQMPDGTAIDLRASGRTIEIDGSGATGFFYNPDAPLPADRVDNADPIVIMFTPEGAIERVRFNQKNVATGTLASPAPDELFDGKTVSNIFLLIGRRAIAPPPTTGSDMTLNASKYTPTTTDQQKQSYKDAVNWLRSESRWIVIGAQSGRVVTVENAFVDPTQFFPVTELLDVIRARQIHAAREFAREMTQIGGR